MSWCRFPYFSADVLASNAMILQALIQGGWTNKDEDEEKDKSADTEDTPEHSLVADILKSNNDNDIVQNALSN